MKPIHSRKKFVPKPKPGVTVSFVHTKPPELPKIPIHPLLTKPTDELLPHEEKKLEIYYNLKEQVKLEDIFVDPVNGLQLFRTSYGTWATGTGY